METNRAYAAATRGPLRNAKRDLVLAQEQYPLGDVDPRDGLLLGSDVKAAIQGLTRIRGMATPKKRSIVGQTALTGPVRLSAYGCEQFNGTRQALGNDTGPDTTDRRKQGNKQGTPLASENARTNSHNVKTLLLSTRGKSGNSRHHPQVLQYNRGHYFEPLHAFAIEPFIANRNTKLTIIRWNMLTL